jgi:hypothetical protein
MKKTLLFLAVFTLGTTAFSQIPNYVPSNGLVGWWPFNGNANDESGNGNNGTVNGATLTTDRFGNSNSAYNFNGNGNHILVSHSPNFINPNMSFSGWVNASQLLTYFNSIVKHGNFTTNAGEQYGIGLTQNGEIHTGFKTSSCTAGLGWDVNITNSIINLNTWYHLVVTIETNFVKTYLNSTLISTYPYLGSLVLCSANSELAFGREFSSSANHFYGSLDDIGIWNRALTECEIQDLYHAQLNSASLSISAGADQSICAGDNVTLNGTGGSNYLWNNNVVDGQAFAPAQSNAYVVMAQDTLGCTGTDTVVVTVLENATSTLTETALDSYTLNGQTYTQSGTYTQTLTAANGCDSTITLNLTLNFTGIDELGTSVKKLVKITDLNGKIIPRRKNTLMLFIYEDGTVERVVEMEE